MSSKVEVSGAVISGLIEGDEAAFRSIYDQLHRRIFQLLTSLVKEPEQAEELLQETFVCLWVNREKLDPRQPLYPYVYLTARRLAIDHFRKRMTEEKAKRSLKLELEDVSYETDELIDAADLYRFAEEAIRTLPRQQQTVFMLSRQQGLSYDEIAEQLEISPNTVKNHLVSALKTLKRHFIKNNITYVYFLYFIGT